MGYSKDMVSCVKKIKVKKGRELIRETEEQQEDLWSANLRIITVFSRAKGNLT